MKILILVQQTLITTMPPIYWRRSISGFVNLGGNTVSRISGNNGILPTSNCSANGSYNGAVLEFNKSGAQIEIVSYQTTTIIVRILLVSFIVVTITKILMVVVIMAIQQNLADFIFL